MMCAKSLSSSSIAHRRTSLIIIITLSLFKGEKKEHWMDWAGDAYNAQLIQDIKAMFKVLFMFLPLPVFWSLFDQQGSRWVLQAGQMNGDAGQFKFWHYSNRPLALRGHVTNASLKQRVVILLLPKLNITQKLSYTRNLRGNAFKGDIFWYFDLSTKHYDLYRLPCWRACSNEVDKTTLCLYLVKCFIVTFRCAINVTTSSFQHFPWSLSAKYVISRKRRAKQPKKYRVMCFYSIENDMQNFRHFCKKKRKSLQIVT